MGVSNKYTYMLDNYLDSRIWGFFADVMPINLVKIICCKGHLASFFFFPFKLSLFFSFYQEELTWLRPSVDQFFPSSTPPICTCKWLE